MRAELLLQMIHILRRFLGGFLSVRVEEVGDLRLEQTTFVLQLEVFSLKGVQFLSHISLGLLTYSFDLRHKRLAALGAPQSVDFFLRSVQLRLTIGQLHLQTDERD